MFDAGAGLTMVDSADLQRALKYVHSGELRLPLTVEELARCGLQHVALELLAHLRGLDEPAVRAVLVAVLAERLADRPPGSAAAR